MTSLRQTPRWVWALIVALVLLACVFAVVVAASGIWAFGLARQNRATVVNVVVATASFVLVGVSAIVALAAYWAATGKPNLRVVVSFRFSEDNRPVFQVASRGDRLEVVSYRQTEAHVSLINSSLYAARNPGVRIEFEGVLNLAEQEGWDPLMFASTIGLTVIQWDGGTEKIVHGHWTRMLPDLNVDGIGFYSLSDPVMIVTVTADGLQPRRSTIPIVGLEEADYAEYSARRAQSV